MKKILSVLMTIAMLAAMPFAAMAEETDTLLSGIVTGIVDGGFVLQDEDRGEVMLNTSDATIWDGILAEGELMEGQYVFVEYDGRMTFSLPPQAHADRVTSAMLTGMVTEVMEDGSILINDDVFGETIVHLTADMNHVYAGMPVTVYYDGVMTLSLPGQVSASHIVLPELTGTVSDQTEEGFTLTDTDGVQYEILFSENTLISEELPAAETEAADETAAAEENADGAAAEDVENAESAAAEEQETVEEAVIEETESTEESGEAETMNAETEDEATMEDGALAEEGGQAFAQLLTESDIEWADGDTVTVYYNGMMTRSIPAQVTAMEIAVIR